LLLVQARHVVESLPQKKKKIIDDVCNMPGTAVSTVSNTSVSNYQLTAQAQEQRNEPLINRKIGSSSLKRGKQGTHSLSSSTGATGNNTPSIMDTNKDNSVKSTSFEPKMQTNDSNSVSNSKMAHACAGAVSGLVSALLLAPLDTIKTRLIVQKASDNRRPGMLETVKQMVIVERGGIRSLYKGLGTTMLGYAPNWAIYFASYEYMKEITNENHVVSAVIAGLVTNICTSPLWVVKTRMQTQTEYSRVYRNTFHALSQIFKKEGLAGLYSGLIPSIVGLIHVGIQFPCYEFLKNASFSFEKDIENAELEAQNISWQRVLFASLLSKSVASIIAYPHEVLRSRLQDHKHNHNYNGMLHATKEIYKHEGIRGFYNGMGTNLMRVVPAAVITLVTYEMTIKYMYRFRHA
jgi:solute carrier family 25 folate transporter 32